MFVVRADVAADQSERQASDSTERFSTWSLQGTTKRKFFFCSKIELAKAQIGSEIELARPLLVQKLNLFEAKTLFSLVQKLNTYIDLPYTREKKA